MVEPRTCSCGADVTPKGSPADYPYDPRLEMRDCWNLDRLRCMEDRDLAATWFPTYFQAAHNDTCPHFAERERARQRLGEDQEIGRLKALAESVFRGDWGARAKSVAALQLGPADVFARTTYDLNSLRQLHQALRDAGCTRQVSEAPERKRRAA